MISLQNGLITTRILILFVFAFISSPSYSNSDLKSLEKDIANEIYDLSALLDSDALDSSFYKESRKKLILFLSRYNREGGDDYRFILPSKTLIEGGDDYKDFNLSFNLPIEDYELRRKAYEPYMACIREYKNKNLNFWDIAIGDFCPYLEPGTLINIDEVVDGIKEVMTFDKKLNEEEANSLLEKHYLSVDKKNREIWFQEKSVELDEDLKTSNIQYNGDPFVRRLVGIKTQGLRQDMYATASLKLIQKINELAEIDVAENRLSSPADNNAVSKLNNILTLDEKNSDAKQGLIDVANKYIDWAKSSAGIGQTAQVRKYMEKALKVDPKIISEEDQNNLLVSSQLMKAGKAEDARKAEQARKVEAERKAQIAEAHRLSEASLSLEQQEQESKRIAGVVDQYILMIKQRIKRNWLRPAIAESGLQSTLRVTSLLPGGDVKQVVVVKSSGNAIFDRSAEIAVYRAAPWPQPTDPKAATILRDFQFIFKPE